MNRRTILIALGFVVALILLLVYLRDVVFHSRSTRSNSQVTEIQSSELTSDHISSNSRERIQSSRPTLGGSEQIDASGSSLNALPMSSSEASTLYLKLTQSTDPEASMLFTDCFWLMDNADYQEARSELVAFMEGRSQKGNENMGAAWWMLAWCILNEGGKDNLLDAADRFLHYTKIWPGPGEYEELEKAAYINRAAIYTELLYSGQEKPAECLINATEALDSFLAKWPDDPQAFDVRNMLDTLNGSYSGF